VPLCAGFRHDYLGNVRHSTIAELWQHPRLEYLRQCHEHRDFAQVAVCLRCLKTS
jgi:MoaA/NifB/PqqE/SkfB family radical SAM enzyme